MTFWKNEKLVLVKNPSENKSTSMQIVRPAIGLPGKRE